MRLLLLAFCALVSAVSFSAVTDYRPYLLGDWQCHSAIVTQFGESSTLGSLVVHDNGELEGSGNLLLSYPGIEKELPLAATLQAKWIFENKKVCDYMSGIGPYFRDRKYDMMFIEGNKHCCDILKKDYPNSKVINDNWDVIEKYQNDID